MDTNTIPAVFRGVQYRSRLEAKWAAFFDLLCWPCQYEPFDLNGWIPDFVLMAHRPVFVEVQPVVGFPESVAERLDRVYPPGHEILIVGGALFLDDRTLCLGWLGENDYGESRWWEPAVLGRWRGLERQGDSASRDQRPFGFCHSLGSFVDRITGAYDGGSCGGADFAWSEHEITDLWDLAGNLTQWRGARSEIKASDQVG